MNRIPFRRGAAVLAALAALGGTVTFFATNDAAPSATAQEQPSVIHYQVVDGDTWANIAARYNLTGVLLAIQNGQTSQTPQPRRDRILHIVPGVPPVTTTTLPPSTTTTLPPTTTVTSTTLPPSTTTTSTTTTVAPTTTTTTSTTTTTTVPPTTTTGPPITVPGAGFVETFTGNTGLDRFRTGVFHRDTDTQGSGGTSGQWQGDHDHITPTADCGDPAATQRTITKAVRPDATYVCREHLMSSMGHVDSYSIVWFSPNQVFNTETKVSWDANVTDLLSRQWYEVMITSVNSPDATCINWLPCDLPHYPADATVVGNGPSSGIRVWSNGGDETPTWEPMCGGTYALDPEGCASKNIRRAWSVEDRLNGTLRVSFNGDSWTIPGSFPSGDWKVVFKSHNYTSDKDGTPVGHTWHWDNIIVQ